MMATAKTKPLRSSFPCNARARHCHHEIRPLNLPTIGHVQLQTNRVLLRENYRELACFPCKAEAVLMRNAAFAVQPLPLISGIPTYKET